jgi:cytochrome c oxidase subunit 4
MTAAHSHASENEHGGAHGDGAVHVHIASTPFYIGIFLALICLTVATVKVSYYDFGSANIVIAILIATMKASLVAAFFMHLRHDGLFNTLAFLAAFLFLGIFILLTYDDLGVRARDAHGYVQKLSPQTGQEAPGGEPATSATADSVGGEAPKEGEAPKGGHGKKE